MTNDSEKTIEFKGRHDSISERMRDHATKKLQKLGRYDRITKIEVIADHAHQNPEVELIAHMRSGAPLVAKERAETFATAIDLLVQKLERQLTRDKEKRTDHKAPAGRDGAGAGPDRDADPSEETYEEVVRKTLRG